MQAIAELNHIQSFQNLNTQLLLQRWVDMITLLIALSDFQCLKSVNHIKILTFDCFCNRTFITDEFIDCMTFLAPHSETKDPVYTCLIMTSCCLIRVMFGSARAHAKVLCRLGTVYGLFHFSVRTVATDLFAPRDYHV